MKNLWIVSRDGGEGPFIHRLRLLNRLFAPIWNLRQPVDRLDHSRVVPFEWLSY